MFPLCVCVLCWCLILWLKLVNILHIPMPEGHTRCLSQRKMGESNLESASKGSRSSRELRMAAKRWRRKETREKQQLPCGTTFPSSIAVLRWRSEKASGWERAGRTEVEVGHNSPRRDWGEQPLQITSERQWKGGATILWFLLCSRELNHTCAVFTHVQIQCYLRVGVHLGFAIWDRFCFYVHSEPKKHKCAHTHTPAGLRTEIESSNFHKAFHSLSIPLNSISSHKLFFFN